MKTIKLLLIFCLVSLMYVPANAQATKKFVDSGAINDQFDYLISKSNRYQEYKVVQTNWLSQLKSNVSDSLQKSNAEIALKNETISQQQQQIDSLKLALNDTRNSNTQLNEEKKSISLFGILINKNMFKTVIFSIMGVLLAFLLLFIARFRRSIAATRQINLRLRETEEEFDEHRRIALEREQKVRRQLQDELNKQKND